MALLLCSGEMIFKKEKKIVFSLNVADFPVKDMAEIIANYIFRLSEASVIMLGLVTKQIALTGLREHNSIHACPSILMGSECKTFQPFHGSTISIFMLLTVNSPVTQCGMETNIFLLFVSSLTFI